MQRKELEQQVFDIEMENKAFNGDAAAIRQQIGAASTEELEFFLEEYKEHLAFVSDN